LQQNEISFDVIWVDGEDALEDIIMIS
jgi:hypothetical protein